MFNVFQMNGSKKRYYASLGRVKIQPALAASWLEHPIDSHSPLCIYVKNKITPFARMFSHTYGILIDARKCVKAVLHLHVRLLHTFELVSQALFYKLRNLCLYTHKPIFNFRLHCLQFIGYHLCVGLFKIFSKSF